MSDFIIPGILLLVFAFAWAHVAGLLHGEITIGKWKWSNLKKEPAPPPPASPFGQVPSGQPEPCVCCGTITPMTFGSPVDPTDRLPVCLQCFTSNRHQRWFQATVRKMNESGVAFPSVGKFAQDFKTWTAYMKNTAALAEGLCPNCHVGMERVEPGNDHNAQCPKCMFHHFSNTPIDYFPESVTDN